jgi:nucleotide-binding universal stress UspA family protein
VAEFKKILYATDFSDLSAWALNYAVYLARLCSAELHCLHVVDDSYQYWLTFDAATIPAGPPIEDLIDSAENQLGKFTAEKIPADLPVVREVRRGRAFMETIRYAREHHIDLIVVGTHGWSALREVLMGSVADKIVRKSPCAVLTVRHPEHGFQMP